MSDDWQKKKNQETRFIVKSLHLEFKINTYQQ